MGDEFNVRYSQRRRECRLREGVREVLAALGRDGIGQSPLIGLRPGVPRRNDCPLWAAASFWPRVTGGG